MTNAHPLVEVVVFDVVGTLADLDAVRGRFVEVGLPESSFEGWFAHLLRDGMALTLTGGYEPFTAVASSSLRSHTRGSLADSGIDHVVAGFAELDPHPDAAAALDAAADGGARVFTLSNGSASSTKDFLDRAAVSDRVEQVLSIDEVRAWKPAPAPYELATSRAHVPPDRAALVAVHSWDIHGARAAGWRTGWCRREETVPTPVFAAADVEADTLDAVVNALCRPPAR
ncbi:MAG: haloacid dehalogenase type II [Rhodococcus sp. (in: high G+C Gram-positive bacteria)]|uniref:haloacid dehalogenase type II n=1 Tax=Rhodococcoides fascians TaxID=1828 RepID=UPI002AD7C963|nr:haloacid dehalogenase type II [Rhodococcus sp. (in: high G+C Gram-positive bacteria)]